jgi:hypothetical protein
MQSLRTTDRLTRQDARRLMTAGFEIEYIETRHRPIGDETQIVWNRPPRPDDIPESEIPY